jgi:cytochrome P450
MSVGENVALETEEVPVSYPMPRSPRCSFDPPSELLGLCSDEPIMRVKIWDGSTPWLVTGYNDVKALFNDRRLSVRRYMSGFPLSSLGQTVRNRLTRLLVAMDEPQHSYFCRMISAEFTKQRAEPLRPEFENTVDTPACRSSGKPTLGCADKGSSGVS